jgi:hypothetical protein
MPKKQSDEWIGVDFDGTLCVYTHWQGSHHTGKPIPEMVSRVKQWLAEGKKVRIFSARIYAPVDDAEAQREAAEALIVIHHWCIEHIGVALPITCIKDWGMVEFWDDRAVQVERNTGKPIQEK